MMPHFSNKKVYRAITNREDTRVKNRIFCPSAGKSKMVFETQKQVDKFFEYIEPENYPEGYIPSRSYYCKTCMGFHVSSKE